MNIENASVVTKLFNTDAGSSPISAAINRGEGFGEALQEQLEALTGLDMDELIEQQQKQSLSIEQFLSTLTGKALPEGVAQIDLEQTLTALKKVLAHLEQASEGLSLNTGLSEQSLTEIKQLLESVDSANDLTDLDQILAADENIDALHHLSQLVKTEIKLVEQEQPQNQETGVSANLASLLKQVQAADNKLTDASIETDKPAALAFDKEVLSSKLSKTDEVVNSAKQNLFDFDKGDKKLTKASDEQAVSKLVLNMTPVNRSAMMVESRGQTTAIAQPVNHSNWGQELGEKVVWMLNKTVPSAEVRLNPQHLGPISIKLDVNQDQASIAFTAQNAVVKEAIEQALPKLREMLNVQQLNLAEVTVSQNQTSDQGQSRGFDRSAQEESQRQNANHQKNVADFSNADDDLIQEVENGLAIVSKGLLSLYV